MVVNPHIVFIGTAMSLELIHAVENANIGVSKNASDAAHTTKTRNSLFKRCSKSTRNDYQSG